MDIRRRDLALGAAALAGGGAIRCEARAQSRLGRGSSSVAIDPASLVNPELRPALNQMLAQMKSVPPMTLEGLASARRQPMPSPPPLPAPSVVERMISGRDHAPDVRVEVIGAGRQDRLRPAVLHIHGDGCILGRMRDSTADCQRLSTGLDCVVVNVDYRLAPETRFPGSLQDNYAALLWLNDNAEALGVDRSRLAIKGESAGGGHAAALAIAARDRGEVALRCQVLIYPMLDDRTGSTRRPPPFIGTFGWNAQANRLGWTALLGRPAASNDPPRGAVPARTPDLSRLPPTFIGVGSIDLFVEEDLEYARRLIDAAVPTQSYLAPGAFRGFDAVAPDASISRQFTGAWQGFLKSAFDRAG